MPPATSPARSSWWTAACSWDGTEGRSQARLPPRLQDVGAHGLVQDRASVRRFLHVPPEGGLHPGTVGRHHRGAGGIRGDDADQKIVQVLEALAPEVVDAPNLLERAVLDGPAENLLRGGPEEGRRGDVLARGRQRLRVRVDPGDPLLSVMGPCGGQVRCRDGLSQSQVRGTRFSGRDHLFLDADAGGEGAFVLQRHRRRVLEREARRVEDGNLALRGAAFDLAGYDLPDLADDVVLCDDALPQGDVDLAVRPALADVVP